MIVTNTIPQSKASAACSKMVVLSVARLLGQAIKSIHEETSVSSLFVYGSDQSYRGNDGSDTRSKNPRHIRQERGAPDARGGPRAGGAVRCGRRRCAA
jgi:hypothetical protein